MTHVIGIVRDGKIVVAAPSDLPDGAEVRIWFDELGMRIELDGAEEREEAKRQFLALTEESRFCSHGEYPSRESLHDRD
jgi:hypothetical protein